MDFTQKNQPSNKEENHLLQKALQGDAAAFEQIYRSYVRELCSFAAYYLKSTDTAKDIVQNVFLILWERRNSIRIEGCLKTYLFTSVRNLCINFLKHQTVHRTSMDVYSQLFIIQTATPHELAVQQEFDTTLTHALEKIPERSRIVFILNRFFNMKYAEIADILEISVKTVDAHMVKAVQSLRSNLHLR